MDVELVSQPYDSSGNLCTLGGKLMTELSTGQCRSVLLCSAFATSSGTSRIYSGLRTVAQAGGTIEALIGVSNGVSTIQAVEHLLDLGATVRGFDTGETVLFHPKVYILENPNRAWVAVGSSNLTCDGLFRSIEASTVITLDLRNPVDRAILDSMHAWLTSLLSMRNHVTVLTSSNLRAAATGDKLIDESRPPSGFQPGGSRTGISGRPRGRAQRFRAPPAPPPYPALPGRCRRPMRHGPSAAPSAAPAPTPAPCTGPGGVTAPTASHFAMTLSAFDASHRRGTPGTQEVSVPEDIVGFFPPTSLGGRKYPDAYFDVSLNGPTGANPVRYRLWHRPAGGRGHADWRINVKRDTIDLTTPGGGDLILFERLAEGSDPEYEVWIVTPNDPTYSGIRSLCTRQVRATSSAGLKEYGVF